MKNYFYILITFTSVSYKTFTYWSRLDSLIHSTVSLAGSVVAGLLAFGSARKNRRAGVWSGVAAQSLVGSEL